MKKDLFKQKFIIPLLELRPPKVDEETFLKILFSTDSRIISAYYVNGAVEIPGVFLENGTIPHPAKLRLSPKRMTKRGTVLWVRVDDRETNKIHVEHKGYVFLLDRTQWNRLKRKLVKMTGSEEI
jgi:hypothetical protein